MVKGTKGARNEARPLQQRLREAMWKAFLAAAVALGLLTGNKKTLIVPGGEEKRKLGTKAYPDVPVDEKNRNTGTKQ